MLKFFTVTYFACLFANSLAALAPFIEPCVWDDKVCLIKSSQSAVPYFADGISNLGVPPLDPIHIDSVTINEQELNLVIKNITAVGTKQLQVIDIERNVQENTIKIIGECPIDLHGEYVASGKILFLPVEGSGPFRVQTNKLRLTVLHTLSVVDGKDGKKHWEFAQKDRSFEFIEKTLLDFENLFNGDKEKATPVLTIINESWKELIQTFGGKIVDDIITQVSAAINKFLEAVPISELEKQK